MTRRLTLLLSAFEAALAFAIGIAIPLVPLTILWAAQYGFGPDWLIFWRASVDSWLIGHGADVRLALDPTTAAALGAGPETSVVVVTIAALGFALLTALLGLRAGARIFETHHPILGTLASAGVFGALSLLATLSALHASARPSIWQGALLPTVAFAVGLMLGLLREWAWNRNDETAERVRRRVHRMIPELPRIVLTGALRSGAAAASITLLVSAAALALALVVSYAQIIRLYESLHPGVAGSVALTAGQLALLPNLIIWTASWFVGPGFAIGTGSSVSPLGTSLGPIPALPIFGAIPEGSSAFGFAGLLVPIVAGFLAGAATRGGLRRDLGEEGSGRWMLVAALGGGVAGGLVMGLLAWASGGAAGPGRLVSVGPDPIAVGAVSAIEFAVAIGIGFAAGRPLRRRAELDADEADATAELDARTAAERRGALVPEGTMSAGAGAGPTPTPVASSSAAARFADRPRRDAAPASPEPAPEKVGTASEPEPIVVHDAAAHRDASVDMHADTGPIDTVRSGASFLDSLGSLRGRLRRPGAERRARVDDAAPVDSADRADSAGGGAGAPSAHAGSVAAGQSRDGKPDARAAEDDVDTGPVDLPR
ncbi:cell division protein PerM [Schumannella soli]|uniref:cell division protein PerM n=1 Tax=Schumannella soli TaxID=2590779 RepID=UPI0015E84A5D|nr:DUF6350 family protein [Schumannella soli]